MSDTPINPERAPTPSAPAPEVPVEGGPELDVFGRAPKGRLDWAHRKGEPRTFALFWMIYLMGASLLMVTSIAAVQSVSPGVVRPAARAMILTGTLGLTVLWPMVRLSQLPPKGSRLYAVATDLLVLLPPFVALTLPQALDVLANWPISVVGAVLAGVSGWAMIIGAVLALGLRTVSHTGGDAWHRLGWTLVIAVIVIAPPAFHALAGTPDPAPNPVHAIPAAGAWMSPVSLVTDLLSDRSGMGRSGAVGPGHWVIVLRVWALAMILWGAGIAVSLARPLRGA